ncbi:MAG: hypothetical protein M3P18_21785 [Actinomycetota bacterium]|nr:hypothetical protein [Actinomycetota bacterium]
MRERMARPTFSRKEAATVAAWLGIDFRTTPFTLEQFTHGMCVELEHGRRDRETDVTHDNSVATAKIAWAHLKELPDYYERLEEVEDEDSRVRTGAAGHPWVTFERSGQVRAPRQR